jgi:hypothetical protein
MRLVARRRPAPRSGRPRPPPARPRPARASASGSPARRVTPGMGVQRAFHLRDAALRNGSSAATASRPALGGGGAACTGAAAQAGQAAAGGTAVTAPQPRMRSTTRWRTRCRPPPAPHAQFQLPGPAPPGRRKPPSKTKAGSMSSRWWVGRAQRRLKRGRVDRRAAASVIDRIRVPSSGVADTVPAQRLLRRAAGVEALAGDVGILRLQPREGPNRIEGQQQVDRDDHAEGAHEHRQHMSVRSACGPRSGCQAGHSISLPLNVVSLIGAPRRLVSSTQNRNRCARHRPGRARRATT